MFNCIMVQTLPPDQFHEIQVQLTFHYVKDLVAKCTELLNYDVDLFYDQACNYQIDSQLSLQQARLNNTIYAKRVEYQSQYPKVTCWFKQDGIELSQGVVLSSDFTFEEVLDDAKEKQIIKVIPESIKVTDLQQTKILATLIQMQMCKLINPLEEDPQLIIHFTTTKFEPFVQLQFKNFVPQFKLQQNFTLKQGNESTLQHQVQQNVLFKQQNFSLQSKPQHQQNNSVEKSQLIAFQPIKYNEIETSQKFQKFEPNKNLFGNPQKIPNPLIKNTDQMQFVNNQQQSQSIDNEQFIIKSLENLAIKTVESMIILGKFSFKINEKGDYVVYQCNSPQISGYFLQFKGKNCPLKNEKEFKWENKFGVQIADNFGKGFIIKWKNNTFNSLTIYIL